MKNIGNGDYASYQTLFFRYYNHLCQFVCSILKNRQDSEDVVQELFLGLWNNRGKILINISVPAYLFRAARNLALNKIRGDSNYNAALKRADFASYHDGEEAFEAAQLQDYLQKCVEELPDRNRKVFILQKAEGLKQKEIAETLGMTLQAVKRHVWIALQKLRACLEKKEIL